MRNTRASCVARRAWVCTLVVAACQERPQSRDIPAPPTQPAALAQNNSAPPVEADPPTQLTDGEGYYGPRTRIELGTLERDSIVAFSLEQPAAIVKADFTGRQQVTHCQERVVAPDTLHLLCVNNVLGTVAKETVTVDGHFLVPRAANGVRPNNPNDDLVDAMVTVRRNGKGLFAERRRFRWLTGE